MLCACVQTEELLQHRTGLAGNLAGQGAGLTENAVELFGLQKVFAGTSRLRSSALPEACVHLVLIPVRFIRSDCPC